MAADGRVILKTEIDTSGVKSGIKSTKDMLNNFGNQTKKVGNQFAKAMASGNTETAKRISNLQKANAEIKKQENNLSALKEKLIQLQSGETRGSSPIVKNLQSELKSTEKEIDTVVKKMDKLTTEADRLGQSSITIGGNTVTADQSTYNGLITEIDALNNKYQQLSANADGTRQKLQEAVGVATQAEIEKTNSKIEETSARLDAAKVKASELGKKTTDGSKQGSLGIEKFGKRIGNLAKRVFVFTVITKALRALRDLFAKTAKTNTEFNSAMSQIKDVLWSLFAIVNQYVMPIIVKVTQVIAVLAQNALNALSKVLGVSTSKLLSNGKALQKQTKEMKKTEKATKKAAKTMAAFDEISQLSGGDETDSSSSGSSGSEQPSFSASAISEETKNVINAILLIVGPALFVIGILFAFTGHIGLGIGLMIAGIAIFAIQVATIDWNSMPSNIKRVVNTILAIGAVLLFAIGIILCSVGKVGLGIALMIAGGMLGITAIALNWGYLQEQLQGTLGNIMLIVGGFLLVLGIILVCCGVLPLGIGLIIAGAGSIGAVLYARKDSIIKTVKSIWQSIKDFWHNYIAVVFTKKFWADLMSKIGEGLKKGAKAAINGLIWLANKFIDGLNLLLSPIRLIVLGVAKAFGKDVSFEDIAIPHIPKLAKGAVIPANKPFLAQLGDQKSGTNIETPLDTMIEAFNIALNQRSGGNGVINLIINGKQFAQATYEDFKAVAKQQTVYAR